MADENELVTLAKIGDKNAFSALVKIHQQGLMRLSLRFMKDVDSAKDVVQDSFIKAYERLESFEQRSTFKSWLYQITINTAKNKLRSRRDDTSDIDEIQIGVSAKAETTLIHTSISEILQRHVDDLPHKQKTALTLRIYEDLSFREIAEIMDCPYDTAKANYRHALLKLKDVLQDEHDLKEWSTDMNGFFTEINQRVLEAEA